MIATRNRRASLLRSLERLVALPERPEIVVVDNASSDGSAAEVRAAFPGVRVVALEENRGAAARNVGVEAARAPYVAFCDDDSWWQPGALRRASRLLSGYPRLGLVAARVLVGEGRRLDPVCKQMAASPLDLDVSLPGPPVLGFIACGVVVRRSPFLAVGGFNEQILLVGEERLLAVDLAAAGWFCAYVPYVVARHLPAGRRDGGARRRQTVRNELWFAWLRLSARAAAPQTWAIARSALGDPDGRAGIASAVAGLGRIRRHRRPLPPAVERAALRVYGANGAGRLA